MSGRMNYDKIKREKSIVSSNNGFSVGFVHKDEGFNKYLQTLSNKKNFNRELYEKGMEYFNLGGILDEAKDELKNDYSFVCGYNKAKRLEIVRQVDEKYSNKSR